MPRALQGRQAAAASTADAAQKDGRLRVSSMSRTAYAVLVQSTTAQHPWWNAAFCRPRQSQRLTSFQAFQRPAAAGQVSKKPNGCRWDSEATPKHLSVLPLLRRAPDPVVGTHADPLGDGAVLLELLGQKDLGTEGLVSRLRAHDRRARSAMAPNAARTSRQGLTQRWQSIGAGFTIVS